MKNQILPEGIREPMVDFTLDAFICKDIPESILNMHSNEKFSFENFLEYKQAKKLTKWVLCASTISTCIIACIGFIYLSTYEQSVTATQIMYWVFATFIPGFLGVSIEVVQKVQCPIKELDYQALFFCQHYSDFISEIAYELFDNISDQTRLSARKFIAMDAKNTSAVIDKKLVSIAMKIIEEERESNPLDNKAEFPRKKMREFSSLIARLFGYQKSWGHYFKLAYFKLGIIPPVELIKEWGLSDKDIEKLKEKRIKEESTDQSQTVSV